MWEGDPAEAPSGADLLAELLNRPAWHADAACRGMGTESFFPERGASTCEAKAVCARCPVQQQCLDHQLTTAGSNSDHGIWGGTSGRERRVLRRDAERPPA